MAMRILVADDDGVSRKVLERYLQQWGYELSIAHDGEEAWRLFQQGDYPIVITDWMMPGVDGIELIRRIRKSEQADCVYTILLSSRSQKEDLVEGMDAGADDFVTKPFDRDELRVRLREGERIVRLERERTAQNKLLGLLRGGLTDGAAGELGGMVDGLRVPLGELALNLTALRREISAIRTTFNAYRDTCQRLAGNQPAVRAELVQLESQLEGISLDGLLDRTVVSLEQVREILKQLELRSGGAEP